MVSRINAIPDDELTNLEQQLRHMREKVVWLVKKHPSIKGNYSLLTYYYWRTFYGIKITFQEFRQILRAPSPESIGRILRFCNHDSIGTEFEGKFMPSDGKELRRREREGRMRYLMPRFEG
jgi:hypothetical protein